MATAQENAAELARAAEAALQQARTERPDLINHYTTCRNFWRSQAKQEQTR